MSGLYQTRLLETLAFAAFAATAASAQSYRAINYLVVVPLNATDFEVIEARGEGARGIWCAAADFAEHALRRDRGDREHRCKTGHQDTDEDPRLSESACRATAARPDEAAPVKSRTHQLTPFGHRREIRQMTAHVTRRRRAPRRQPRPRRS